MTLSENSKNESDSDFICFWCRAHGHLKRQCKLYYEWKNSKSRDEKNEVGYQPVSSRLQVPVRVKIDLPVWPKNKTVKKYLVPIENHDLKISEFLQHVCQKLNCEYSNTMRVFVDDYEILVTESVEVLRDNDNVRISMVRDGKRMESVGVQCKSMIRYSSHGIQCELDKHNVTLVKPVKVDPVESSVPTSHKKEKMVTNIASSSSGYRTVGKTGKLVSDCKPKKRDSANKSPRRAPVRHESDADDSDNVSSSSCSTDEDIQSRMQLIRDRGRGSNESENKPVCNDAVNYCPSVPRHLWRYYHTLGWEIS